MAIFYDRTETSDEIIFTFKHLKLQFITVILLLLVPVVGTYNLYIGMELIRHANWFMIIWFGLVIIIATERIAHIEIGKAARNGKNIAMSGTRFSSKNPLTYKVKK